MADPTAHTPPPADATAHGHDQVHGHEHGHEEHISDSTFFKVFGVLLVCTFLSFAVNQIFGHGSPVVNFVLIAIVAIVKAVLVMYFFMHLKLDWRKVFVFLVPILILAPLILIVLWPDAVLAWRLSEMP